MRAGARVMAAVVLGLLLGSAPFLRYAHFGSATDAHRDHEPHHGGQLAMVGDHHVELVRAEGEVRVHPTDARRHPVEARSVRVAFDRGTPRRLRYLRGAWNGPDDPAAENVRVTVALHDGVLLETEFTFPADDDPSRRGGNTAPQAGSDSKA